MKNIITLLLSVISMMSLASCMSEFEPDIESTPVVCLNANAVAGDSLIVSVTRTWRWSEGIPDENIDINLKEADVEVWVNGELRCRPSYSKWPSKYPAWYGPHRELTEGYRTDYVPSPGDHIYIKVHDAEYGDAEGEVTVPIPTKIDGLTFSTTLIDDPADGLTVIVPDDGTEDDVVKVCGNVFIDVHMTDPEDTKNYYRLDMDLYYLGDVHISYTFLDFSHEPLFTEHVSSLESLFSETYGYTFFSDRQISGQSYGLRVEANNTQYFYNKKEGAASNKSYVTARLFTISESYYNHVISMWRNEDGVPGALGGVGLGDPVWMESNVSTGAGVVSASSSSEFSIPISEFFGIK